MKLNGFIDFGVVRLSTPGLAAGTYVLGQVWVYLRDSTSITIDTTSRVSNSLRLVTSQAVGYVPIWKKADCPVCVHSSPAGDANCSGAITLADAIYLVNYIFKSGLAPCCKVLGDANCSGTITLADIITLVNYLFKSGPAPQSCP